MHVALETLSSGKRSLAPCSLWFPPQGKLWGMQPMLLLSRMAAKIQPMGELVNVSRTLITDLGTRTNDPLKSKPQYFPAWLGVSLSPSRSGSDLQPQLTGANECWAAMASTDPLFPSQGGCELQPLEMQAEWFISDMTSFHCSFTAITQNWLLGQEGFTPFLQLVGSSLVLFFKWNEEMLVTVIGPEGTAWSSIRRESGGG